MRSRVSPATGPLSLSTRDTVATDTPAARATSRMVTRMWTRSRTEERVVTGYSKRLQTTPRPRRRQDDCSITGQRRRRPRRAGSLRGRHVHHQRRLAGARGRAAVEVDPDLQLSLRHRGTARGLVLQWELRGAALLTEEGGRH